MDRTINVTVTGEFVRKDSKNAGVQGEANVTGLHIVMSDDWEAFSKRIIWRNALGESPWRCCCTTAWRTWWQRRTR